MVGFRAVDRSKPNNLEKQDGQDCTPISVQDRLYIPGT